MGNNKKPEFLNKWGRSPAQHRRTVVNGKFVELSEPVKPEEQEEINTALELVREERGLNGQTDGAGAFAPTDKRESESGGEYSVAPAIETGNANGDVETSGPISNVTIVADNYATIEKVGVNEVEPSESEKLQAELEPIPHPIIPGEAFEFIEATQKQTDVLSGTREVSPGPGVLDGEAGRTEKDEELDIPF